MAICLRISRKQLHNLLSRTELLESGTQGVRVALHLDGIRRLDLTVGLASAGVPAGIGFGLAQALLEGEGRVGVHPGLEIRLDRAAHQADLESRLREAVERAVPRRRGRPARRTRAS